MNNKLIKASMDLYKSACWETKTISKEKQIELWENLRDALGLPKGTATKLKVGAK